MFQRCDNKTTMKGRVVVGRSLSESGWCEPDTKPIMKNLRLLTEILYRKVDLAGTSPLQEEQYRDISSPYCISEQPLLLIWSGTAEPKPFVPVFGKEGLFVGFFSQHPNILGGNHHVSIINDSKRLKLQLRKLKHFRGPISKTP